MRIALLSDIHGNSIALDAVLADIEAQANVDEHWILGDLAAIGFDPVGVLERVAALPGLRAVRGNTDRYVTTGALPPPSIESVMANPERLPMYAQVVASFAWTLGAVTTAGWFDWLANLPLEQRLVLPSGARLLGVHASPGRDDGRAILPNLSDAELEELLVGSEADIICVGHTHWALDRAVGGRRAINIGSVSNPFPPDLRASYALLDADATGVRVTMRRVDYDRAAVAEALRRVHHPAAGFISGHFEGKHNPPWMRVDK